MADLSWKTRVYILAGAQMITMMGAQFVNPFLPLFILEIGVKDTGQAAFWAGTSQALLAIAMLVAGPLWGMFGDRYGKKKNVLRAMFGTAVTMGLTGFSNNIFVFVVLRVAFGAVTGISMALTAMVATIAKEGRLGYAMGILQGALYLGSTLGPLAGGIMADTVGFKLAFLMTGVVLCLNGVAIFFFIEEDSVPKKQDSQRTGLVATFRYLMSFGGFRVALLLLFMVYAAPMLYQPMLALFVDQISDMPAATITGVVFAVMGLSGAISAFFSAKFMDKANIKLVIFFCCLGAGLFYSPLFFVTDLFYVILLLGIASIFSGCMLTAGNTIIGRNTPKEKHGFAFGMTQSAFALAFGIGPLTGGLIAQRFGLEHVFLTNSVAFIFIGVLSFFLMNYSQNSSFQK